MGTGNTGGLIPYPEYFSPGNIPQVPEEERERKDALTPPLSPPMFICLIRSEVVLFLQEKTARTEEGDTQEEHSK